MKLPFITVLKSSTFQKLKDKLRFLDNRPDRGLEDIGSTSDGLMPMVPISYEQCFNFARASDTIATIHNAIRQEIFRNGGEFHENFINKCISPECGKEFESKVDVCDECKGPVREPDIKELKKYEKLFDSGSINYNGQLMSDVLEQVEDDLNTVDIAFLLLNRENTFVDGELTESIPKELIRMDPLLTRLIADKKGRMGYDENGKRVYTCLDHRTNIFYEEGKCTECGNKLVPAYYISINQKDTRHYYTKGEVFHTTRYKKSLTYGWPPIILIWRKIETLILQDGVILDWYKGRKPPRGILFVATRSWEKLKKAWDHMLGKIKKNPNGIYPMSIEVPSGKGGKMAELISFMNNFEEMQYTQTREEIRRTMGAVYGVMPIFQADMSTSGGLNNEGLQVTVTTRTALYDQATYNKKIFPWLIKQFKINDYHYELNSPEEKDEMAELQRKQMEIANAQIMLNMGFEVKYNEEGEFEFSGEAQRQELSPFGGQDQFGQPAAKPPKPDMGPGAKHHTGQPESFTKDLKKKIMVKKFIQDEFESVEKDLDVNIVMKSDDLNDFLKKAIFDMAFSGISKSASDKIKAMLIKDVDKKISMTTITKAIMSIGKVSKGDAERITRTEFLSVLQNKAREFAYERADPEKRYRYVWQGPKDHRTTDICMKITKKASRGVKLKELRAIVKKEADPKIYDASRPWTPHINCRHRLIRRVK